MASGDDLTLEQWDEQFWSKEDQPFHVAVYSPTLVRFYDRIITNRDPCRVLIPLCGISLDMLFLADKGHEVVGVECSEIAAKRFFEENSISYIKENLKDHPFVKYQAKAKTITIYQGDFLDLNPNVCGVFDVSWHKGSFDAINVSSRAAYAEIIAHVMIPGSKSLMEASEYDTTENSGPPFSVSENDMERHFGDCFDLETLDVFEEPAPPSFRPGSKLYSRITLLTEKKTG